MLIHDSFKIKLYDGSMENRRSSPRQPTHVPVILRNGNSASQVSHFTEMSATGARVSIQGEVVNVDDMVTLIFQTGNKQFKTQQSRVVRTNSGEFAVCFDRPLDADEFAGALKQAVKETAKHLN